MQPIDQSIEASLNDFNTFLKNSSRQGRENEVVNIFAHNFLAKYIDISQIGIEVAVKQLPGQGKELVRKDLVIREKPNQTVRDEKGNPVHNPMAILEWKVNDITKCENDIEWLKSYSEMYPNVLLYSVCALVKGERGIKSKYISF